MFRVKKKKIQKVNLAVVYIFCSLSFYGTLPNFLGMFHLHQKKWPGMQARELWAGLSPGVLGRDQRISDVKRFLDVSLVESRSPWRHI